MAVCGVVPVAAMSSAGIVAWPIHTGTIERPANVSIVFLGGTAGQLHSAENVGSQNNPSTVVP